MDQRSQQEKIAESQCQLVRTCSLAHLYTIIHQKQWNLADQTGKTALTHAVIATRVSVTACLLAAGVNVNVGDELGMTPLHFAVQSGSVRLARLLVAAGADVQAASRVGETPLIMAAKSADEDMVTLLLGLGADTSARDFSWRTAAQLARIHGFTVHLLEDWNTMPHEDRQFVRNFERSQLRLAINYLNREKVKLMEHRIRTGHNGRDDI